jgi:CheY-like chemotaxis protein
MTSDPLKILILDDDVVVRESLVFYLEDNGFDVQSAVTGEEALDLLSKSDFDGAIVDIRLPGMDGSSFIRKAYEIKASLACVICTGSPEYDIPTDITSLEKVSKMVFSKPVKNLEELKEELINMVNKK